MAIVEQGLIKTETHTSVFIIPKISIITTSSISLPLSTSSLSQEQLTSTGGVWLACDQFAQLPQGQ